MYSKSAKETTSVKVVLEWAKEKLLGAQIESPILDARLLLGFALDIPQERFYGSEDKILRGIQADNYAKIIEDLSYKKVSTNFIHSKFMENKVTNQIELRRKGFLC